MYVDQILGASSWLLSQSNKKIILALMHTFNLLELQFLIMLHSSPLKLGSSGEESELGFGVETFSTSCIEYTLPNKCSLFYKPSSSTSLSNTFTLSSNSEIKNISVLNFLC